MASKLVQLQSKACQASKFVAKHGTSYYRQLLEQNKHYIQEPATVEKCSELSKQLLYTRLARSISFLLSLFLDIFLRTMVIQPCSKFRVTEILFSNYLLFCLLSETLIFS